MLLYKRLIEGVTVPTEKGPPVHVYVDAPFPVSVTVVPEQADGVELEIDTVGFEDVPTYTVSVPTQPFNIDETV